MDKNLMPEDFFDEYFERYYNFLKPKEIKDLDEEIAMMESTVETMVIHEGNNWGGRSEVAQVKVQASIAAAETLLADLREMKEKQDKEG